MAFRSAASSSYAAVPDTIISIPSTASSATAAGAPPPITQSWESLRRQARALENDTEAKLAQYAKLSASSASTSSSYASSGLPAPLPQQQQQQQQVPPTAAAAGVELELADLLARLTAVVAGMAQCLDQGVGGGGSNMHMLQRHRDILYEYSKEFKKTKANIKAAREHAELLGTNRDSGSSYKAGMTTSQDMLLNERSRIDTSHRMADEVLEAAYAARGDLNDQRSILYGAKGRVGGVIARFPLVNDLLSRIHARKQRDSLIMAGVISACACLLLWYWMR
ncbi:Golgi SNAP receptor complex member 1 [Geranomyces variabilis]|uniref:Golgi SNAP receptor complex member 1 n=1 Tax=Geranomyces variabilis TaxID=109894 RepID=A0AAD5TLX3_9FUNG|nr:Golgi SNAP receptor complex member 1 [Geranomyces variabilis]